MGDVILEVSGKSLVGVDHQQAVETLRCCSQVAHLTLQKGVSTTVRLRRGLEIPRLSTLSEESSADDELTSMGAKATTPKGGSPPPSTPPILVGSMPGDVLLYPMGTIYEDNLNKRIASVDNLLQANLNRNISNAFNSQANTNSFQDHNQFKTRITVNSKQSEGESYVSEQYLSPSNSWATKITVNSGSSPAKVTVNNDKSADVIRLHVSFTNDDTLSRRHSCGSGSPSISSHILYPRSRRRSSSCGSLSDTVTLSSVSSTASSLDPNRRPPLSAAVGSSVYLNPFWDDNSSEGTNSHSGSPLLPNKEKSSPKIFREDYDWSNSITMKKSLKESQKVLDSEEELNKDIELKRDQTENETPIKIEVGQYEKEDEPPSYVFPFITQENTFEVSLEKNSRGLGLSVCGGWDTDPLDQLAALIRIKRLYPLQPAIECGSLSIGDILLSVNGRPLTGLSYFEAIEVLRMAPANVILQVCRPDKGILPPIPQTTTLLGNGFLNPFSTGFHNSGSRGYSEFDVTLTKINGSLGFTLVKLEDIQAGGHYIKALVKEPALTDGRLRPGDRLIWVNGVDISEMSHAQAIQFLRDAPQVVTLCIWRENCSTETVLSPLSPLNEEPTNRKQRPKLLLRKEAMDMLSDKSRKKAGYKKGSSPLSSPRNRREQRFADSKTASLPTTLCRKEEVNVQRTQPLPLPDVGSILVTEKEDEEDIMATSVDSGLKMDDTECVMTDPIDIPAARRETDEEAESFATAESPRPQRPSFLDLSNNSLSPRKQMFGRGLLAPPPLCGQRDTPDSDSFSSIHYLDSGDSMFATDDNLTTVTSSEDSPLRSSTASSSVGNSALLKWRGTSLISKDEEAAEQNQIQEPSVMTVELERGWNSRLGFSLMGMGSGDRASSAGTFVRVIYPGSVAAHDGRLKVGDKLIQVNGTCVRTMSVDDIIELLRKTRGKINLMVERAPDNFQKQPTTTLDDNEALPRSQSHQEEILSNELNAKNNNMVTTSNFRWETRPLSQDENENFAGRTNIKVNI